MDKEKYNLIKNNCSLAHERIALEKIDIINKFNRIRLKSLPIISRNAASEVSNYMEKRINNRRKCDASIVCAYFNKENVSYAKMLNYSQDGMYFESDSLFEEGSNIFFKIKDCLFELSDPDLIEGLRTASLAQVKWCKNMGGKDASHFGIGVKYYRKF